MQMDLAAFSSGLENRPGPEPHSDRGVNGQQSPVPVRRPAPPPPAPKEAKISKAPIEPTAEPETNTGASAEPQQPEESPREIVTTEEFEISQSELCEEDADYDR